MFLSLRISFAHKNNNLHNHSQKSFRAKFPYSAFAKLKFWAIPQFRTKIRNRLSSKSLDNFSFGHAYFLKVGSSALVTFLHYFIWDKKDFSLIKKCKNIIYAWLGKAFKGHLKIFNRIKILPSFTLSNFYLINFGPLI